MKLVSHEEGTEVWKPDRATDQATQEKLLPSGIHCRDSLQGLIVRRLLKLNEDAGKVFG